MKQFKCSMSKKKEAVSRGSRDLLDDSELTQEIQSLYENELEKLIDGADEKEKPYYQSMDYILEEVIPATVESIQNDMYKYVSGGAYNIPGNFKQINWDWDRDHKDGIKFNDLRKKLLNGVNDADTEEFSHWGIDWFFKAFGTFGLKYNFREAVTDIVYNDMAEDGVLDESKKPESKKSEGISDMIDAKIDYNMFMRMCKTAAYLEEDEDYWDALWEYFSEVGSIGDACEFFDNLFQYTAWKTAEELWSDFSDILGDKPEDKDYEEALDAYLDENDNEVGNAAAFKYGDHYLMLY